jgi:electron transport complex protein RnfB
MDPITTSTLCIGGVGLVSAAALAVADKFLTVPEDPSIVKVTGCLPGANCGGCGFAGCADYARAIVKEGAELTMCAPAGSEGARAIGAVLGRDPGTGVERKVALVLCCGDFTEALRRSYYNGIAECSAAQATAGGDKGCTYGCLGYASCVRACPAQAIRLEKGIAKVNKTLCISCGKCVATCPRKLIKLVPFKAEIHVLCSSQDKGPVVKKVCGTGCLGCKICTKLAGDAIMMDGFLAKVDYTKELNNPDLITKCPGKCIRLA